MKGLGCTTSHSFGIFDCLVLCKFAVSLLRVLIGALFPLLWGGQCCCCCWRLNCVCTHIYSATFDERKREKWSSCVNDLIGPPWTQLWLWNHLPRGCSLKCQTLLRTLHPLVIRCHASPPSATRFCFQVPSICHPRSVKGYCSTCPPSSLEIRVSGAQTVVLDPVRCNPTFVWRRPPVS